MNCKIVCLYHRSDLDGHCGGAICKVANPSAILHGIEYGDEIPWSLIENSLLYMIDWSFQPWSVFETAIRTAVSIVWIDHHKSAIDDFMQSDISNERSNILAVLDITKSGCELAWEHFFPNEPMPEAVRLLGRYDVWDHSDPGVIPFQYRLRMEDTDPEDPNNAPLWRELLFGYTSPESGESEDVTERLVEEGMLLVKYQTEQDAKAVEAGWFPLEWNGMMWQAYNRIGIDSKFFDSVRDKEHYHGMLPFGWNGKCWVVGLLSDREDVDCGAIAKKFGGGGHKCAAGFVCDKLPFGLATS